MIYDITQDLTAAAVYPGDPAPHVETVMSLDHGDPYTLSTLFLCAHTGTHLDAPAHFIAGGKTIGDLDPATYLGPCYVAHHQGNVTAAHARAMLAEAAATRLTAHAGLVGNAAANAAPDDLIPRRLLIAGRAVVTEEAATIFSESGLWLLGNESQTVGPEDAPMAVHRILLGAGMALLEGVALTGRAADHSDIPAGWYYLVAAPLRVDAAEGAPCRAMLLSLERK